jgi:hypothetical protein
LPVVDGIHDRALRRLFWESGFGGFLRVRLIGVALGALALATLLWPILTLAAALLALAATLVVVAPRVVGVGFGLVLVAFGLATWPLFTMILVALGTVGILAWRAPTWGFVLALTLFGTEGSIKAALSSTTRPLDLSPPAVGAAFTDAALAIGVAGLLVADRGASLRALWARLTLLGRIAAGLLAAWLVASVLQIPLSGDLERALLGFRVTQLYVIAVPAGVVLASLAGQQTKTLLLVAVSPIVFYAALRVAVGPSSAERLFTAHRPGVTQYGEAIRATGSFSGAVGLVSFVVPAAALAVGLLLSASRRRAWASAVIVCSLAAIVASYTRAALVGLACSTLLALVLIFAVGPQSARRRVTAVAACAALFVVVAGATVVTSTASPQVRQRVDAVLHPESDLSLRMRLDTWDRMVHSSVEHPIGSGLGTVGRASGLGGAATVTADESYLKILYEQGIAVGIVFLAGMLAACAAIVAGLRRCASEARPVGIAALSGFVSFLVLAAFGEYVEQPGKALAWTLLGVAAWQAHNQIEPIS